MDAIKKKMEKLSAETAAAETRIETFERMKEANEAEAEKYEEQLRLVSNYLNSHSLSTSSFLISQVNKKIQNIESNYDVAVEDLFNQSVKLEAMEKKASAKR